MTNDNSITKLERSNKNYDFAQKILDEVSKDYYLLSKEDQKDPYRDQQDPFHMHELKSFQLKIELAQSITKLADSIYQRGRQ